MASDKRGNQFLNTLHVYVAIASNGGVRPEKKYAMNSQSEEATATSASMVVTLQITYWNKA